MSEKQLKESFVRNLNGTSISEISLGISITPLCILFRGLILVSFYQTFGDVFYSWKYRLFLDFILLVLPQVLSCTVFSDFLALVVGCMSVTCASGLYMIYRKWIPYKTLSLLNVLQSFLNVRIEDRKVPSITTFRVFLNLLTAISILAVDFPMFPRRYAKTETYGTGVMDLGVGCFTFANALISPEARARHKEKLFPLHRLKKQLVAVWPLVFLGLVRLLSVKAVDYHEHVSEYGVHWNFFFTLAIVRVFSSFLLTMIPAQKIWIAATVIISSYQIALETTYLKAFILHGSDNRGTRLGFLNANREGIFSVIGYVGIYMIGVQVGSYLLNKRTLVKEWAQLLARFTILSVTLFISVTIVQVYIEPISRRMVNLPFCIWTIGQCMVWLCMVIFCDLLLLFVQYLIPGSHVPSTWNICSRVDSRQKNYSHPKYEKRKKEIDFCLIGAINRNQLLFFLHSNIMTGVVNLFIDTIHSTSLFSLIVLLVYMFLNCLISCILHVKNITVKWW
ncbi:phosphatidylinositol-glycan biosynthesis class W protein [Bufo gargarizans]|uniref:phosphatidylinositol-glycan biosynthesis class W protein n=1 Tax=Bufo gargarizans TaxID=30331 RepID=UPI001CF38709|nr:phosphatidylinositol-glycan biosynthesis class W protein [Bufo gargarizans]XP_044143047.1 phosphatidylinositol-glycan biosynthesis class W protein [Bufo gargarizans]XP_044143048.1 phosphatidylinositol-glycan biosynthesis class W protein [Bufo gargarizans]XP_044143049.1 phosphatidylinositol-glycan biosynthesis class W protein [Bufo gargarizans]XP_044143050.1 phosphatidylinositol-glycan biosynthesis class W protein [Bufo gargarizans]XP_044143051.1 phosphatidylinositol-glycan biosynthesis clas